MYEKVKGPLKNCEAGTKVTNGIAGLEPREVFVGTYGGRSSI